MNNLIKLAERLERWQNWAHEEGRAWKDATWVHDKTPREAAAALRECATQEPVAWMYQHDETGRTVIMTAKEEGQHLGPRWHFVSPLYAAPVPPIDREAVLKAADEMAYPSYWQGFNEACGEAQRKTEAYMEKDAARARLVELLGVKDE